MVIAITGCGTSDVHSDSVPNMDLGVQDTLGDSHPAADAQQAISVEGDWFTCDDTNCEKLVYTGYRLGDDGLYRELSATPPYLEPNEKYCHTNSPNLIMKYTKVGDQIILTLPNSNNTISFAINKLTADMMVLDGDPYKRVYPARSSGTCGTHDP